MPDGYGTVSCLKKKVPHSCKQMQTGRNRGHYCHMKLGSQPEKTLTYSWLQGLCNGLVIRQMRDNVVFGGSGMILP